LQFHHKKKTSIKSIQTHTYTFTIFFPFFFFFYIHTSKYKFETTKQKLHYTISNYKTAPKKSRNCREGLLHHWNSVRRTSGMQDSGGASAPRATTLAAHGFTRRRKNPASRGDPNGFLPSFSPAVTCTNSKIPTTS
jgi:hypothetical protein